MSKSVGKETGANAPRQETANSRAPFIERWSRATASERANSQPFLSELCDELAVPRPDPFSENGYKFEFCVPHRHPDGSTTEDRIDLYKRGCFVLESKQFQAAKAEPTELQLAAQAAAGVVKKRKSTPTRGTKQWDDAMFRARGQAERYVRSLPASEPNPPFLLVVDVGDTIEVFADFTQAGRAYLPFPDPRSFRIRLADLANPEIRDRLRLIWTNPQELNPAHQSAAVTKEIAVHLAALARSLESAGHPAQVVAEFLTRCLFCMFAEDVGLLPERSFTDLLLSLPDNGEGFEDLLRQLFREMNSGTGTGVSVVLRKKLLRFNGGLFANETVLPVNREQLTLLRAAALQNWKNVEPAIFGTLLERALNPTERHKLGAHYTPRAYVERLVLPTVIEPLRAEWQHIRAAAVTLARNNKLDQARKEILEFHRRLCELKVLDPACGSGNFLYVTLEHLKRLEGEVLDLAASFGETLLLEIATHAVDPHQFLGIEVNPRAAAITELVLWIGYLQWHFRTRGKTMPAEPVLKKFKNIECRDAVLAWNGDPQPAKNEQDQIITTWDRRSYKKDPLTGRSVPDEAKRVPLFVYSDPQPAEWPAADFVVGNPPFIGTARMREDLGDGYAETLRKTYPTVPESSDFVMYWWHKAAEKTRNGQLARFGLITTNSLSQTFNRRVVQEQMDANPGISLSFAIPDHPWVDTKDGAAVRIAMTVGVSGHHPGELWEVTDEKAQDDGAAAVSFNKQKGKIHADLSIGAKVVDTVPLQANDGLSSPGVKLHGSGFIVTTAEARALGLGQNPELENRIRAYRNGKDLTNRPRGVMVIDLFGLGAEEVRRAFPSVYQWVLTRVKPERDANNRDTYRNNWWIFGEPRKDLRPALKGLNRYIATVETTKHRVFQFLDAEVLPDNMLVAIALDDAYHLGVLSSRIHVVWTLAAGGTLEDRPRYNKSRCFDPFPFPVCNMAAKERIRRAAEALDAHRKQMLAQHPKLTLTGLYNVLEKLRNQEPLTKSEKVTHELGLVSVLKDLHDEVDSAVFAAYEWPSDLNEAQILEKVVELNAVRSAEEKNGTIRWLRPEYQCSGAPVVQRESLSLPLQGNENSAKKNRAARKLEWPKTLAGRVKAVEGTLRSARTACTADAIAKQFRRAKAQEVMAILETLCTLGHAQQGKDKDTFML